MVLYLIIKRNNKMKDPDIHTTVRHSRTKTSWDVVGTVPGKKYKIAQIPYTLCGDDILDTRHKAEALEHAQFISNCFNNSSDILKVLN